MDNLDVPEGEEDDDSFDKAELNDSSDRELAEKDLHTAQKSKEGEEQLQGTKPLKTDRTATHKKESPLIPPKRDLGTESRGQNSNVTLTLEEEIEKKVNAIRINQGYINNWEWGKENAVTGTTAQNGEAQAVTRDSPSKMMRIDHSRYEAMLYPTYILQQAYNRTFAVGSATALVAILNKNELSIANIGDSGFLVIRFKHGEPFCPHKSKEQ